MNFWLAEARGFASWVARKATPTRFPWTFGFASLLPFESLTIFSIAKLPTTRVSNLAMAVYAG